MDNLARLCFSLCSVFFVICLNMIHGNYTPKWDHEKTVMIAPYKKIILYFVLFFQFPSHFFQIKWMKNPVLLVLFLWDCFICRQNLTGARHVIRFSLNFLLSWECDQINLKFKAMLQNTFDLQIFAKSLRNLYVSRYTDKRNNNKIFQEVNHKFIKML